jgi:hypothetical protein
MEYLSLGDPDVRYWRGRRFSVGTRPSDATEKVEALSDALPFLVARDGDRPTVWLTDAFMARVAASRTYLAAVRTTAGLVARIGSAVETWQTGHGRFEAAARHLAADPRSVAIAIRLHEIQHGVRLPSWPEILRRRSLEPRA